MLWNSPSREIQEPIVIRDEIPGNDNCDDDLGINWCYEKNDKKQQDQNQKEDVQKLSFHRRIFMMWMRHAMRGASFILF